MNIHSFIFVYLLTYLKALNYFTEYLQRYFPKQIHYNLESFIEYIGRIPTIRMRETSVRAHYVCYKKVEAQWLRMDDSTVHKVDLMTDYNINLLFYRRANVPIQTWNLYLDFLPSWRPSNMPAHPALTQMAPVTSAEEVTQELCPSDLHL